MGLVLGVDGCRAGWLVVGRGSATGGIRHGICRSAGEIVDRHPTAEVVAIDIPIGLPELGSRECDVAARRALGPRRSSVFPAPIRPAIDSASHQEASRITERIDGRRVSVQAWWIFPKIRDVDSLLSGRPELRSRFHEVHPELSFAAMNAGLPLDSPKKRRVGRKARRGLLEARYPGAFEIVRAAYPLKDVAHDDILDALAALHAGERILRGEAVGLPDPAPLDACGLPMQIRF